MIEKPTFSKSLPIDYHGSLKKLKPAFARKLLRISTIDGWTTSGPSVHIRKISFHPFGTKCLQFKVSSGLDNLWEWKCQSWSKALFEGVARNQTVRGPRIAEFCWISSHGKSLPLPEMIESDRSSAKCQDS